MVLNFLEVQFRNEEVMGIVTFSIFLIGMVIFNHVRARNGDQHSPPSLGALNRTNPSSQQQQLRLECKMVDKQGFVLSSEYSLYYDCRVSLQYQITSN